MDAILRFLGEILIAAGGAAVLVLAVLAFVGRELVDDVLQRRLERVKADYERDLERFRGDQAERLEDLRHRLDRISKRASKLDDKEFEVILESWRLLQDAKGYVGGITHFMTRTSNPDKMPPEYFEEWIEGQPFSDYHKNQIREAEGERTKTYQGIKFLHDLDDARKQVYLFNNHMIYNRPVFASDLYSMLEGASRLLQSILITAEMARETKGPAAVWMDTDAERSQLETLSRDIGSAMRQLIHPSEGRS